MELTPIQTRRIAPGEDLVSALVEAHKQDLQSGDIIVISSKAVATSEGRVIDLAAQTVSEEAQKFSEKCGRTKEFCEAVLEETKYRNGKVVGTCPGALLTELKPWGPLTSPVPSGAERSRGAQDDMGVILTANAGLDESNAPEGCAIGWPEDPVESVRRLRMELEKRVMLRSESRESGTRRLEACDTPSASLRIGSSAGSAGVPFETAAPRPPQGDTIAIILSDSCCRPRRWGVTAYALAVAGIDPLQDQKGVKDLYGRTLRITQEAVADQLATAANALMGNANRGCPAVLIRDHEIPLSDYVGWVPGIAPEEDLFSNVI